MTDGMQRRPAAEEITTLYDTKIKEPLADASAAVRQLLADLDALSDKQRAAIRTSLQEATPQTRENFAPADALSALPSLARNLDGLAGFFQVAKGEKNELTPHEAAAGMLRYEPLDQLTQTILVLKTALENSGEKQLAAQAQETAGKTESLQYAVAGTSLDDARRLDGVFLNAVRELSGYKQLLQPLHEMAEAAEQLAARKDIVDSRRDVIEPLVRQYKAQCESVQMPDMPLEDITAKAHMLEDTVKLLGGKKTRELTPQEEAVLGNFMGASDALRTEARGLHSAMNAINLPVGGTASGPFDELLPFTAQINAQGWQVHKAIGLTEVGRQLEEAVKQYKARPVEPPSTALTGTSAIPVTAEKQRALS